MITVKDQQQQMFGGLREIRTTIYNCREGIKNGAAALESSLAAPQKVKG